MTVPKAGLPTGTARNSPLCHRSVNRLYFGIEKLYILNREWEERGVNRRQTACFRTGATQQINPARD